MECNYKIRVHAQSKEMQQADPPGQFGITIVLTTAGPMNNYARANQNNKIYTNFLDLFTSYFSTLQYYNFTSIIFFAHTV